MEAGSNSRRLGVGLDAGGTQTRWALADSQGTVLASGHVEGLTALLVTTPEGRARLTAALRTVAAEAGAVAQGHGAAVVGVMAGLTGYAGEGDANTDALLATFSEAFGLAHEAVTVGNDVDVLYRGVFAPGEGYLVYAGTGSIGVYVTPEGAFERVGGRGGLIDDGGAGYWIAREALRLIWRAEDERPGDWRGSALAKSVFEHVGGSDWNHSRDFMYTRSRGEIGQLALAVARAADEDPEAMALMHAAGEELARLANALRMRHGPRPLAIAGRATQLHPAIEQALREHLAPGTEFRRVSVSAAAAAARLAASVAASLPSAA